MSELSAALRRRADRGEGAGLVEGRVDTVCLRDGRDQGQTFGDDGDRNTDSGGDGPGQGLAAQQGQPGHGGPAGQGDRQSAATMVVPS